MLAGNDVLHGSRQLLFHFLKGPVCIEDEGAAVLDAVQQVILGYIGSLVAGDVVGMGNKVAGLDGLFAETQVGNGEAARLLGVIGKVCLGVEVGVVTDDFDGLLVGTDCAVSAEAEELALDGAFGHGVKFLLHVKGEVGDIVVDAHGEVVLGAQGQHVVVDGLDHAGREVLGAQAVAAADNLGRGADALFLEHGADVKVQGLAKGAGFLGAVKHSDFATGGGQGLEEVLGGEGTVQVDAHQADFFALGNEVLHGFFDDFAGRAHADDDAVGIGSTGVLEKMMPAACDFSHLFHVCFHDGRNVIMEGIAGLDVLEVNVGVLGGAADVGMAGAHCTFAEIGNGFVGGDFLDVLVVDDFDFLDFVRSPEAVEEVEDGNAGLKGGKVGNQGQIHTFLDRTGAEHGEAGLPAGHNVLVVTEDGQGMAGQGTGGNMEDAGQKLAGDLVHVGDHQEQALGGSVGGSQRACCQHAVHGTGGAGFGLHFADFDLLAKDVFGAFGCHLIDNFAHNRRRGNGIDGCGFGHGIRNPCGCVIAVHGLHFSHVFLLTSYTGQPPYLRIYGTLS